MSGQKTVVVHESNAMAHKGLQNSGGHEVIYTKHLVTFCEDDGLPVFFVLLFCDLHIPLFNIRIHE